MNYKHKSNFKWKKFPKPLFMNYHNLNINMTNFLDND